MTDRLLIIMALLFITGLLLGILVSLNLIAAIALGLAFGLSPIFILFTLKRKRLDRINEQLPDLLDSLARSLQAGNSFSVNFDRSARKLTLAAA